MPAIPASLRLANQATILEQLLGRKAASRAELAKATGMSKPTTGKIIDDLVHAGVVEEIKLVDGGRPSVGRPGKQLRLATSRSRFVVIDLGVELTRFSALPPSPPEQERWEVQFKTPASADAWQEKVVAGRREGQRQAPLGGHGQHARRRRRARRRACCCRRTCTGRSTPTCPGCCARSGRRRSGWCRRCARWPSASSARAPTATTS